MRYKSIIITSIIFILISITTTVSITLISSIEYGLSAYESWFPGLVIVSGESSTPITGLLPLKAVENISRLDGVLAVSPEILVAVYIDGQPAIARGVDPLKFNQTVNLRLLSGDYRINEPIYALAGHRLAHKLNLDVGDVVLVRSVVRRTFTHLKIAGIYISGTPLDDELIVNLEVGMWLRGIKDEVTVIKVKAENVSEIKNKALEIVLKSIYPKEEEAYPRKEVEGQVKTWSESISDILSRVGYNQYSITIVLISILFLLAIITRYVISTVYEENMDIAYILWTQGMSTWRIWLNLILIMLIIAVPSIVVGYLIGYIMLTRLIFESSLRLIIHLTMPSLNISIPTITLIYIITLILSVKPVIER